MLEEGAAQTHLECRVQGGLRAAAGAAQHHLKAQRRTGWGAVRPQDGRGRCRIVAHSGLPQVLGRWGNTPGKAGAGAEGRGSEGAAPNPQEPWPLRLRDALAVREAEQSVPGSRTR